MRQSEDEQGYALIIVLFVVVFITIMTAVFMRGALSNAKQEIRVDENNLVVVAAESGVDYYTFELKKAFNKDDLQKIVNQEVEKYNNSKSPIIPLEIQAKLIDKVKSNINRIVAEIDKVQSNSSYDMADDFDHELMLPLEIKVNRGSNGEQFIKVAGDVKGEQKSRIMNTKLLNFNLNFSIPPISSSENNENSNNGSEGIILPTNVCIKTTDIENENCLFPKNKTSDLKSVEESKVFLDGDYSGWKDVDIDESYFYMKNFTNGAKWNVEDSDLVVTGNFNKYSNFELEKSKLLIGGNFVESGKVDFDESHITIGGKFLVSTGESEIEDSFMLVGSNFDSPSKIKIQKTHLTIGGTMLFNSGGTFQDSSLKIASDLTAPSKLYIQNSKLTIGGKLLLNTGADIENSEMIVGSDVSTSTPLKLKDSNIIIGGNLKLTNQSDWLGANVKIVGNLTSPNGIKIQSSTIITKSTELGTLNLQKTKFCAEDFNVKQNLTLDKESEIYYLKTSTHKDKNNQINQLSKAEFDVMCSYNLTIEDPILPKKPKQPGESQQKPNSPDDILWYEYEPKLEKVTY